MRFIQSHSPLPPKDKRLKCTSSIIHSSCDAVRRRAGRSSTISQPRTWYPLSSTRKYLFFVHNAPVSFIFRFSCALTRFGLLHKGDRYLNNAFDADACALHNVHRYRMNRERSKTVINLSRTLVLTAYSNHAKWIHLFVCIRSFRYSHYDFSPTARPRSLSRAADCARVRVHLKI